jgi:hypothetical protein
MDGSLMWFIATITLRRFVAGSGRRPPHQKRTHAPQQKASLFDHFVGEREQLIEIETASSDEAE